MKLKDKNSSRDTLTNERIGNGREAILAKNAIDYVKKQGYLVTKPARLRVVALFSIFLFIILSFHAVSADPAVSAYSTVTKTVTLVNNSAPFASVTLNTPLINYVMTGNSVKVAELTFNLSKDTEIPFNYIRLYDKQGNMVTDRSFLYKIKTVQTVNVTVPTYAPFCFINEYSANYCRDIVNGSMVVKKTIESWGAASALSFRAGLVTVGIFTQVKQDDYIEWLPSLYGNDISQWAVWTSGFNVGLMDYYNFSETSGTSAGNVIDGLFNLTTISGHQAQAGKSGYGYYPIAEHYPTSYNWTTYMRTNTTTTVKPTIAFSFWMNKNQTATGNYAGIVSTCGVSACNSVGTFMIRVNDGGQVTSAIAYDAVSAKTINIGNLPTGYWEHIVVMLNSSALVVYWNGTLLQSTALTNFTPSNQNIIWWDGSVTNDYPLRNTTLDEIGVWNRTLTSQEISDLYNAGAGIYYQKGVDTSLPSIQFVNLTLPDQTTLYQTGVYQNSSIYANVSAFGNLLNITLNFYNSTGLLNSTSVTGAANTSVFMNMTFLPFGTYKFNATAYNPLGSSNSTATYTIYIVNSTVVPAPPAFYAFDLTTLAGVAIFIFAILICVIILIFLNKPAGFVLLLVIGLIALSSATTRMIGLVVCVFAFLLLFSPIGAKS